MTEGQPHFEDELRTLGSSCFEGGAHQGQLKDQLTQQHAGATSSTFYRRHQIAVLLMFGLLLVGGGIAGTQAVLRAFVYDIELQSDGEVIATPRILVNEGQAAQMTMTDEDGTVHIVNIDEAGRVTYLGDDEAVELDVAVSEPGPDAEAASDADTVAAVQLLYSVELRRGDELLSSPRVFVLAGQKAVVTISDESGVEHITTIHEDGTVSYAGDAAVTMEYEVEELPSVPSQEADGDGGDDH